MDLKPSSSVRTLEVEMTFRDALVVATILAIPLAARAQPVNGPYVGLGIGWNYLESEQLKGISTNTAQFGDISRNINNKNVNFGSGLVALGSVGWGFGNGIRLEVEGNYRGNYRNQHGQEPSITSLRINVTESGGENKAGVMVNALYDFTDLFGAGITPYLGGGIGWQSIQGGGVFVGQPFIYSRNGNTNAFGYQAIAGMSYTLASIDPGLALTAEYRFLGVGGNRSVTGNVITRGGRTTGVKLDFGPESNQAIIFGVRYAFGRAR
jgi:OmpA-OmpF porin, OOP family